MRQTARRHAINAVRPSPARVEAPEPGAWIPILDLELLEALGSQIDPMLLRELDGLEQGFLEPAAASPRPGPVRRPPAAATGVATGQHRHRFLHWLILVVALAVVAAGVPYFLRSPAQRRVTLDVDGASFARTTRVGDVRSLLTSAGIAVGPGDQVTPAPGAALRDGATVRVVRAVPVTVDVDGAVRSVRTTAKTVKRLRRELGVLSAMVAVGAANRLRRGDTIVFRTPFDVTLITDGVAGSLTSTARTVGELLAERGVSFAAGDQIDPPLATPLSQGLTITITHTTAGRVTEDTAVPFAVQDQADASLPEGTRRVVQSGVDGIDRTTFQLTHDGDTVVGRQPLGTVSVRAPRPEIVAVGTQPIGATGRQTGIATWYATLYQPGTCAHLRIPFGTMVRVTDTETGASATCRVADRGPEAWTGNIIDLSPDVFEQLQPLSTGEVHVRVDY
ncbi:MAG: ubiquitin-like domain-containing protein [Acidimicrobiia bacterium]